MPPEMLERIIQIFVKQNGIIEAWKIRGVCSQ